MLRHAAPEAFEFILENSAALRGKERRSYGLNEQEKRHQKELKKRWNDQTKQVDWSTDAALKLVQFLFPALGIFPSDRQALQGVRNHSPTDYWARYLAGELNAGEIADQLVLGAIRDSSQSAEGLAVLAVNMHTDRRFAWKWQYLVVNPDHNALLQLADKLIELILKQDGADADADGDALLAVWRKVQGRTKPEAIEPWLEHVATRTLPVSVSFFNDFRNMWIAHETGYYFDQDLERVYAILRRVVRSTFEGSSVSRLAAAFSRKKPYAVYQLFFLPVNKQVLPWVSLIDPSDSCWFTDLVLNAAGLAPEDIVPQIFAVAYDDWYVTRHHRDELAGASRYRLEPNRLESVFKKKSRKAMEFLAKLGSPLPDFLTDQQAEYVCQEAREWLARTQASGESAAQNGTDGNGIPPH